MRHEGQPWHGFAATPDLTHHARAICLHAGQRRSRSGTREEQAWLQMKVRKVIRVLTDNGFRQVRQSGSHRQFEGFVNGKRRLVTVAGKESSEVRPDTLASIRQQSGLPRRLFR